MTRLQLLSDCRNEAINYQHIGLELPIRVHDGATLHQSMYSVSSFMQTSFHPTIRSTVGDNVA